jgi:hypothetical protein
VTANQRKRLMRWSQKAQDKAPAAFDTDRSALPTNPVESTALRMRTMEPGNGVTPYVLSEKYGRPEQVPTAWHTGRDSSRSQGLG